MEDDSSLSRREFLVGAAASAVIAGFPESLQAQSAKGNSPWAGATWFNEPHKWQQRDGSLVCTADPQTDFWQKTFYGYSYDSGHFYHRPVKGDFTTTMKITGKYRDQYDQAGLMLRVDKANWMKCGVEFVDGRQNVSVVMTREFSDWSTARLPEGVGPLWMRVVRKGPALDIFSSLDGKKFEEIRVGYFGSAEVIEVGPMCAAPTGNGFEVQFEDWELKT